MEISNKITLTIIDYILSRLVTLLKGVDVPIQISDIFNPVVIFMFITLAL
jgi:hypothetical protein